MEAVKPSANDVGGSVYLEAVEPRVGDVWLDGNEEIVMVEAVCPNEVCSHKVITFFTMPRVTSKVQECRFCKTRMVVSLPEDKRYQA